MMQIRLYHYYFVQKNNKNISLISTIPCDQVNYYQLPMPSQQKNTKPEYYSFPLYIFSNHKTNYRLKQKTKK